MTQLTLSRKITIPKRNIQFTPACVIGDLAHVYWEGRWQYNTKTGECEQVPFTNADGTPPVMRPENFDVCDVAGQIFQGNGAPAGKFGSYDPATQIFTQLLGGPAGRQAIVKDLPRNRLLSYGGSQNVPMQWPLPSGPWVKWPVQNMPVLHIDYSKTTFLRHGEFSNGRCAIFADNGDLYECAPGSEAWAFISTSGAKPPNYSGYCYYEPLDTYFNWCGANTASGSSPALFQLSMMPRSTMVWEIIQLTLPSQGIPARGMGGNILVPDPANKQLIIFIDDMTAMHVVDLSSLYPVAPPTTPPAGNDIAVITSFPLPRMGVMFPFSSNGGSKHTNIAEQVGAGVIVNVGGDWQHSATNTIHTMTLDDGVWTQVNDGPVWPTNVAPNGAQDNMGVWWDDKIQRFRVVPGNFFPYPQPYDEIANPTQRWSYGEFLLDPTDWTFTQDLRLFGSYGKSTGSPHAGVWDDINNCAVVFGDSANGNACRRYDLVAKVRLPDIPYKIPAPVGFPTAKATYFTSSKHAKIGRKVYIVGYSTDGTTELRIPRLFTWDLDAPGMVELSPPPVDPKRINQRETRLCVSYGKVVYPVIDTLANIYGILVYDPANNLWKVDTQIPPYGNFICNSTASLSDGRAILAGGVAAGKQQTHIWFYEAK